MRFFRTPKIADHQVSAAEEELFGGPLRYDTGWADHENARLELTLLTALRAMPRLVLATLRRAWRADRGALLAVGVSEVGQGVAAAVNLLVLNSVMHTLLSGGPPAERVQAALPALLTGAAVAVVNAA
ncbi:ABC transporter ATP-binding protein, partial [Streptomyces sp. SID14478]|nr:ABC transporter ATP-binding protein [Streptomyces sp. SID14478]